MIELTINFIRSGKRCSRVLFIITTPFLFSAIQIGTSDLDSRYLSALIFKIAENWTVKTDEGLNVETELHG